MHVYQKKKKIIKDIMHDCFLCKMDLARLNSLTFFSIHVIHSAYTFDQVVYKTMAGLVSNKFTPKVTPSCHHLKYVGENAAFIIYWIKSIWLAQKPNLGLLY